jgi:hypothetical protein
MKKYAFYVFLAIAVSSLGSCTTTYVVRERPAEVIYERPLPPSREHIWITGDWFWEGGRYAWHEGHYERRREGYRWEGGHWQNARGGWKWVRGHWIGA